MSTAAEILAPVRSAVEIMVADERRRSGSLKQAYGEIASVAEKSTTWVRRFIKGHPDAKLCFVTGVRIARHYRELCERIEADAVARRAIALALKAEIDAVLPGNLPMDRGMAHRATPETAAQKDFSQKGEA